MNNPRDQILIEGLHAACIIGDETWERTQPQEVRVDLALLCDCVKAGTSDALHDTVDYAAVASGVLHYIRASRFRLIEALADGIAQYCLARFSPATVSVTLRKPSHIEGVASFGVRITRTQHPERR